MRIKNRLNFIRPWTIFEVKNCLLSDTEYIRGQDTNQNLVQVLHGSYNHGFYSRWMLISLCAHTESIRRFDLLKAFDYTERVSKSEIFLSEKNLFTSYMRNVKRATI